MSGQSSADDNQGRRGSMFGRMSQRFQDAIDTGRGDERPRDPIADSIQDSGGSADDLAMKRSRAVKPQRMIVPEGVVIEGALTSGTETEIEGRVDGDVSVEGRLFLGRSSVISGNVRAAACKVDGQIQGTVDCSHDLELGESGKLSADASAGRGMLLSGHVTGNVVCGGLLRVRPSAQLNGNIRAKTFVLEEGAVFNGECAIGVKPKAALKDPNAEKAGAEKAGQAKAE